MCAKFQQISSGSQHGPLARAQDHMNHSHVVALHSPGMWAEAADNYRHPEIISLPVWQDEGNSLVA